MSTFKVGNRVTVTISNATYAGVITHRTWENGSYVRLDSGEEIIVRHQNLKRHEEGGA
jgi:hypothetical protein